MIKIIIKMNIGGINYVKISGLKTVNVSNHSVMIEYKKGKIETINLSEGDNVVVESEDNDD